MLKNKTSAYLSLLILLVLARPSNAQCPTPTIVASSNSICAANSTTLTLINGVGASNAVNFDGNNDYLVGTNSPSMTILGDITLETWVNISAQPGDWVRIIGKGDGSNRTYGMWYSPGGGSLLFQQYGGGVSGLFYSISLNTNTWYHIAMVRSGSNAYIYLNGVQTASNTGNTGTPYTSSDPFQIGYAGFHTYLPGKVDEVRVWNVARTPAQISANMSLTIPGILQV